MHVRKIITDELTLERLRLAAYCVQLGLVLVSRPIVLRLHLGASKNLRILLIYYFNYLLTLVFGCLIAG